jgi:hypothetical protein
VDGEGSSGATSNGGDACPAMAQARRRRAVVGSTVEQGRAEALIGGSWAQ